MYFVGLNGDSYSALVTAVMYAISCYIRPCYNGTQLYIIKYVASGYNQNILLSVVHKTHKIAA